MGYPVVLTPQSQEDLASIVRHIARASPDRARSYGNVLIDQALAIGAFPEMGRIVPELGDPAIREITHESYRIIYEVFRKPTAIYVLRFWHAARGTPRISREG